MKRDVADALYVDRFEVFREQARKMGFCSPRRLGIAVGYWGGTLPGPYAVGSRAEANFMAGFRIGREQRHALRTAARRQRHLQVNAQAELDEEAAP